MCVTVINTVFGGGGGTEGTSTVDVDIDLGLCSGVLGEGEVAFKRSSEEVFSAGV